MSSRSLSAQSGVGGVLGIGAGRPAIRVNTRQDNRFEDTCNLLDSGKSLFGHSLLDMVVVPQERWFYGHATSSIEESTEISTMISSYRIPTPVTPCELITAHNVVVKVGKS